LGRNAEAYVDDIVVKSRKKRTLIEDLEEMFTKLRKVNIKLNPAKYTFRVPSDKLLGFLVSHRGIEANPDRVRAIEEMQPPHNLKEMQRLRRCMATLGCFIARSGERALPFFKLMKRTSKFQWTLEAAKDFDELKRYIASPPIMVAPRTHEPLLLYLPATPRTACAVLIVEWKKQVIAKEKFTSPSLETLTEEGVTCEEPTEAIHEATLPEAPPAIALAEVMPQEILAEEGNMDEQSEPPEELAPEDPTLVQHPIYIVSMVLRDAHECYTMQQKLLYTLLITSRKLCHYFQGHPITVVTSYPLEQILRNPNVTSRNSLTRQNGLSISNPLSSPSRLPKSSRARTWRNSPRSGQIPTQVSLTRKSPRC
jgi:hypothetical protein